MFLVVLYSEGRRTGYYEGLWRDYDGALRMNSRLSLRVVYFEGLWWDCTTKICEDTTKNVCGYITPKVRVGTAMITFGITNY